MAEERRRPRRLDSSVLGITFGWKELLLAVALPIRIVIVASVIFMIAVMSMCGC